MVVMIILDDGIGELETKIYRKVHRANYAAYRAGFNANSDIYKSGVLYLL